MAQSVKESLAKAIAGREQTTVEKWTGQFAAYEREFSKWEKRAEKILKRYRDEERTKSGGGARFNILWSNVQTLIPATFSRIPQADVSRRFKDNDPVGRLASMILERALSFEMEHYPDFRETMKSCVFDRFLSGRGTAWARYEPHIKALPAAMPVDGEEITEDASPPNEELDYECSPVDYVHWKDFGHTFGRTWEEVTAIWRKVYMTREAMVARFGEGKARTIPLDATPEDKKGESGGDTSERSRALIYEVWDKSTLKVYWISKSQPEPVDEKDDPLGLEEFWPCPKPLFATMTNESLVPVPDFTLYQDQARELDTLCERIDGLIQALQVKGVYDSSISALARIFTEGSNGTLIPIDKWAAFAEKNGLAGAIDIVDLKPIYEALQACYLAIQSVLQQIYDLTGLSDIIRGESNANETATAQRIKGQYASLRLKAMQTDVALFATGLIQLKAQIICAKFDPQTILKMAAADQLSPVDQQNIPAAMELLLGPERMQDSMAQMASNPLRNFRIEVNADTMVEIDEQEEKENRVEFIKAQAEFMEKALPMAQASPLITPLIATLWKFGVQAFKVGKTLEGEFDQLIDQMKQAAANPSPPPPSPEMMRVQMEQQANQMRLEATQQSEAAKMQNAGQIEQMRLAAESERHMKEIELQGQIAQMKAQTDQETELKKVAMQVAGQIRAALIAAKSAETDEEAGVGQDIEQTVGEIMQTIDISGNRTQDLLKQLTDSHQKLVDHITAPKMIERDAAGNAVSVGGRQILRGPDGKVLGVQ